MKAIKSLLILLIFCVLSPAASATHLVGGSMSYKYEYTLSNGNLVYRVRLDMYRDASLDGTSQPNAAFDPTIMVGIHNNNSSLSLHRIKVIGKTTSYEVNPVKNTTCPNNLKYRVEYGYYSDTVVLPPSTVGYHLTFARCCRNKQTNLPNDMNDAAFQGQTYYCKIPPTNIKNSSPFFSQLPIPLICAEDTTNMLITATDPDKDSLVYSFVTPFQGGSSSSNGAIPTPPPFLSLPLPEVVYRSGYSGAKPFGAGDYTKIISSNGLTTMFAPESGQYAVAIRVNEFRNGVLISSTYLDLQFFVIDCPPNKKPYVQAAGSGGFYKQVEAGKTLCFNITSYDQDGSDSVYFEGFGDIFTGQNGFVGPKATLSSKDGKTGTVNTFCWTPSCVQASDKPYIFAITVRDNGCLPKSETYNFAVNVSKVPKPSDLQGPIKVCQNETAQYDLIAAPGYKIKWKTKKAKLISAGEKVAVIRWDSVGVDTIFAWVENDSGCVSDYRILPVTVSPAPTKPEFTGDSTVCQYTFRTYTITNASVDNEYHWFVVGGNIESNNGQSIGVRWGSQGEGKVKVFSRSRTGIQCKSDTVILPVKIVFPEVTNFVGSGSVCPYVRGVEYILDSIPGSIYIWSIKNGTQTSGGNSHKITVNWGAEGKGQIKVFQINKLGCSSDTFFFDVEIGYILEGMAPIGDRELCEYSTLVPYYVYNTNGSTYAWLVTGGTIVSGQYSNKIIVDWGPVSGSPGTISVTETAWDSVNNKPCIGKTHKINVKLNPLPTADQIEGKMEVCQHTGSYNYQLKGFGGSKYTWSIVGPSNMSFSGQGTSSISVVWDFPGTYKISVKEMSKDSCPGAIIDTFVIVRPKPVTSPIRGDTIVCYPFYENNKYAVTGYPNSTYKWTLLGGSPVEGSQDSLILINWTGLRYSKVTVVETSQYGCVGDPVVLNVITDNPKLSMKYVSVGFPDDRMEIAWDLIDGELYNSRFSIEKRKTGSNDWNKVRTVSKDTFYWLEKPLNTDQHSFDYHVLGYNLCGNQIESDIHTNINLKGKQDPKYVVNMSFSNYRGWIDGVRNYELYRKLPGKSDLQAYYPFPNDSSAQFGNGFDNFTQCYRVKAYQVGTNEISWSNEICFDFDPIIWVPNAFTPNEDLNNPRFKVVTASLKTYEIQIYDRWGEKIFVSNDPEISWDGTYRGRDCAQGVYMYIIQYSGFDNRVKQLTGDITLIR